jgi:hypothetical protein
LLDRQLISFTKRRELAPKWPVVVTRISRCTANSHVDGITATAIRPVPGTIDAAFLFIGTIRVQSSNGYGLSSS